MKVKCNYCGKEIEDTDLVCPYCGAPNDNAQRNASSEPHTIEELKQWYVDHNLPPEEITRFFIGKDIKEKRAFGIYKDENSEDFIVYKNKDNGQRAVRYKGKDERYAVNELYQRLKEEISNQKSNNKKKSERKENQSLFEKIISTIKSIVPYAIVIGIVIYVFCYLWNTSPDYGYYNYNGSEYHYGGDGWYIYDSNTGNWDSVDEDDVEFKADWKEYSDESYSNDSSTTNSDWDYDWDNDSSWSSSDSWDSSSSDWDSDW